MMRMIHAALLAAFPMASVLAPGPVLAQGIGPDPARIAGASQMDEAAPQLFALLRAIGLYEILEVMATEGMDHARTLEADMFPGQGGTAWPAMVARLYGF